MSARLVVEKGKKQKSVKKVKGYATDKSATGYSVYNFLKRDATHNTTHLDTLPFFFCVRLPYSLSSQEKQLIESTKQSDKEPTQLTYIYVKYFTQSPPLPPSLFLETKQNKNSLSI